MTAKAQSSSLRIIQSSFTAGELDPLMRMRPDLKIYAKGLRRGRNIALLAQGGFRRRPGSVFRYDLAEETVLHPYSYADGQEYVFGFQNTQCRIFNSSGSLLTTLTSAPWLTAGLYNLTLASSGDTTIVCDVGFIPQIILRTGASSFTLSDFAFEEHSSGAPMYQPYFKYVADSVTMTASATTGTGITLTASSDVFTADHVGTIIRLSTDATLANYKEVIVTGYTDATHVTADVRETLFGTTATIYWDEQAFSDVRGYPRAVTFHDGRLMFAGNTDRPDGIWGSKKRAFFNFDVGTATDTDAIDVSVGQDQINEIRHIVSTRHLQVYSNGGELYVPQSPTASLTPTTFRTIQQTPYGVSRKVNPLKFDGGTLFLQRSGKVIREFLFSDTEQAYNSGAVSIASNHLISDAVDSAVMLGTDERPEQYALFVNTDGTIAVFHSIRNEDLAGWVQWNTNGTYYSVTAVDTEMFAVAKRTINGATVYWLEQFDWDVTLDSADQLTAASTDTYTVARLLNTTIRATTENAALYLGEFATDASGIAVFNNSVTNCDFGLNYDIDVETMPIDATVKSFGSITGERKRISRVVLSVISTQSVSLEGTSLILRQATDDLSIAPTAAEGDYEFYTLGWSLDPTIVISQDAPLPLVVRGIYMEVTP